MTRLISWITHVVREPETTPGVHFHAGTEHRPEVCYDTHCRRPALEV